MGVSVKKVNFAYERVPILKDVSFKLPKGKMTALIGPNGSGKSTLLKTMLGLEKPSIGHVCLDGKNISEMRHRDRAKKLAFLSQFPSLQDHMTVEDLVKLGRQHNKRFLKPPSKEDMDHFQRALDWVGLAGQADTSVLSLSGGQRQRQRAFLAMVLAQDTDYIFLDEPTSYLDIRYQIEFIELLKALQLEFQKTIVIVLHDLSLVSKYADYIVTLKEGQVYSMGSPNHVFTEAMLWDVFRVCATICPIKNTSHVMSYDFRRRTSEQ